MTQESRVKRELVIKFDLDDDNDVTMSLGIYGDPEHHDIIDPFILDLIEQTPWMRAYLKHVLKHEEKLN